jgi:hypothetical protein
MPLFRKLEAGQDDRKGYGRSATDGSARTRRYVRPELFRMTHRDKGLR